MPSLQPRKRTGLIVLSILSSAISLMAALLFFADKWARSRFPMQDPQIILANAFTNTLTAEKTLITSFLFEVISPVILVLLLHLVMLFATQRRSFCPERPRRRRRFQATVLLLPLVLLFYSSFIIWQNLPVEDYLDLAQVMREEAQDSDFFNTNWVEPADVTIRFPDRPRNLILIFLESMESSFQDRDSGGWFDQNLIPQLSQIAKEHISFSHESRESGRIGGGIDVTGTGWTIAGIVSKTMGMPYRPLGDENPDGLTVFLPDSLSLFDILAAEGYHQRFICGSDITFASRDAFFATHGQVETRDWKWYRSKGKLPTPDYGVFWGFEDRFLWQFAREELEELSSTGEPFMLSMLTVDTHFPQGYICAECGSEHSKNRLDRYKDVILCADRQAASFIEWASQQDWFRNTVIVLVGDHLFMTSERFNIFEDETALIPLHRLKDEVERTSHFRRRWYNVFINPVKKPQKKFNRSFSSFDIFPSILEAMGARVDGHALGFGRSLFSSQTTLLESMNESEFNLELIKAGALLSGYEY